MRPDLPSDCAATSSSNAVLYRGRRGSRAGWEPTQSMPMKHTPMSMSIAVRTRRVYEPFGCVPYRYRLVPKLMVVHRLWTGAEHSSSAHRAQTLAQGPGLVVKGTRVGSGRCVLVLGPSVWRTRGQDRDARRTKSHSYHHLIPHPLSRLWAPRFCAGLPLQFQILVVHAVVRTPTRQEPTWEASGTGQVGESDGHR